MARPLRIAVFIVVGVAAVAALLSVWRRQTEQSLFSLPSTHAASLLGERSPRQVVASGLVEPVTKELRLGFDLSGILDRLLVKEGDQVTAGQALAILRQKEYLAGLEEAGAKVREAQADLDMHLAGARPAEREQAESNLNRAQIWLEQAERESERREIMVRSNSIGREELERARRDWQVARFEHNVAMQEYILTNDRYRSEEIEMARQRLAAAEAARRSAEAQLDKSVLRAPVDGRILRIFSDPGEASSIFEPAPILSMGDTSTLNVRVEVDERDVARIRMGQRAVVRADAFGEEKFPGTVTRLELSMTPKRLRSGDPAEPVDRSVLEVLVTLDAPGPFYSGMRVDAFIEALEPSGRRAATTTPEPVAAPPATPAALRPARPERNATEADSPSRTQPAPVPPSPGEPASEKP